MKKRVLGAVIATLALCMSMTAIALAEDQQLDNTHTSGNTEVDATILDAAGEVAYIVTVPEKIDFGKLVCPDTDTDSFTGLRFDVTCVEMQGVNSVKVSVYNDGSTAGETNQYFYLKNQTKPSCTFLPQYELYADTTKIETSGAMPQNGYDYIVFTQQGQSIQGGVRLNQNQLYPYKADLTPIAGNYTGTLVFTTSANAGPAEEG